MASESVQLAWQLSISGSEEVKARIAELHEQFNRGEISVEDYGKGLNKASSTARALGSQSQLNTRIFLAQHPTINQLSRTMSGFNRVLNATLAAQNAINIASLLAVGRSSQLTTLQNELAAAERDYNNALDPETKEKAARHLSEIKAQIEETKKSIDQGFINNIFSFGTAIASVASTSIITMPAIAAALGVTATGVLAIGGIIVGAFLGIAAAIWMVLTPGDQVAEFFKTLFPGLSKEIDQFSADVDRVFTKDIPGFFLSIGPVLESLRSMLVVSWGVMGAELTAIWNQISKVFGDFWTGLVNFTQSASNIIVNTVQSMTSRIIAAVKSALEWLTRLPGNIAQGASNLFNGSSNAIGLTTRKAAVGMDEIVRGPTLIMAGEGGQAEHVRITPIGSGSRGANIVNNFNYRIEGSLYRERDLERLNDGFIKKQYRRHGLR